MPFIEGESRHHNQQEKSQSSKKRQPKRNCHLVAEFPEHVADLAPADARVPLIPHQPYGPRRSIAGEEQRHHH